MKGSYGSYTILKGSGKWDSYKMQLQIGAPKKLRSNRKLRSLTVLLALSARVMAEEKRKKMKQEYKNMDYDALLNLKGETLSEKQFEKLADNQYVRWWERVEYSDEVDLLIQYEEDEGSKATITIHVSDEI